MMGENDCSSDLLRVRGECYVHMKEYAKGVADLRRSAEIKPDPLLSERIKEVLKEWEASVEAEKGGKTFPSFFSGFRFSSPFHSPFHSPRKDAKPLFQYDVAYGTIKTEYEEACDVLGVSTSDSLEEVRKRFHALALQCHPDKNPDEGSQERFIALRKAYEYIVANH